MLRAQIVESKIQTANVLVSIRNVSERVNRRRVVRVKIRLALLTILILVASGIVLLIAANSAVIREDEGASNLRSVLPTPVPEESWLILPDLPVSATDADVGAEIYRLVCRDCHGDKGQGLTDEWRATWAPKDQNCWQSKCHASNHPPEGFILPRYVPAVTGPTVLSRFKEPADWYEFIRTNMPFHNPGSLTDEEYLQLTAYLIRENGGEQAQVP